jgi:hypothetical protein
MGFYALRQEFIAAKQSVEKIASESASKNASASASASENASANASASASALVCVSFRLAVCEG